MNRAQLEVVRRFCEQVGKPDLFEYLGCAPHAGLEERLQRLEERREWAERQPPGEVEAQTLLRTLRELAAAVQEPMAHLEFQEHARRTAEHNPTLPNHGCAPPFESAADFLRLVESPDLFHYLGLDSNASSEQLLSTLETRRKWAQAQQNNPKYRDEARRFISTYADLQTCARNPDVHLECQDFKRKADKRSKLRTTIQTMIGDEHNLTPDLRTSFERAAQREGIGHDELTDMLDELGLTEREAPRRAAAPPNTRLSPVNEPAPLPRPQYVPPDTTASPQNEAPTGDHTMPDMGYMLRAPTATPAPVAPATSRGATPNTGPSRDPSSYSSLRTIDQVHFDAVVFGSPTVIAKPKVRFFGAVPLPAIATPSVPWLTVDPNRLDPATNPETVQRRDEQGMVLAFQVIADPRKMPSRQASGQVVLQNTAGEQVTFEFVVQRRFNWARVGRLSSVVATVIVACGLGWLGYRFATAERFGQELMVKIDPPADVILLDGEPIGTGDQIIVPKPRIGSRAITVLHPNFKPEERTVMIRPGATERVDITLALDTRLDYTPGANDVRTPISTAESQRAAQAIEPCRSPEGAPLDAQVSVYVLKNGRAARITVQGPVPPSVEQCITRRLAATRYEPLTSGDYALLQVRFNSP